MRLTVRPSKPFKPQKDYVTDYVTLGGSLCMTHAASCVRV
jgi:hypothetical protein